MNKKNGVSGLILMVVLATVMVSGCIGSDSSTNDSSTNNDKFPKAVTFQGVTFNLPDGYTLKDEVTDGNVLYQSYESGSSGIGLFYYPSISKTQLFSNMRSNPSYTNVQTVDYGGVSGLSADYSGEGTSAKIFAFEKNGKAFSITLSDDLSLSEYIPKILG